MKHTWWTYKEMEQCKNLYKQGNTIQEIAAKLNRNEISIKNLLVTERITIE